MDRQGVAPGLRLRRGAVGRGFGCGRGRLGINVHREPKTDLWRGPRFEFPGRRHHGAGRPFVALDDPQDPAHQATIASGAENAVRAGCQYRPMVCLLSAPLQSAPGAGGGAAGAGSDQALSWDPAPPFNSAGERAQLESGWNGLGNAPPLTFFAKCWRV